MDRSLILAAVVALIAVAAQKGLLAILQTTRHLPNRAPVILGLAAGIGFIAGGLANLIASPAPVADAGAAQTLVLPPREAADDAVHRREIASAWLAYRLPGCHEPPETVSYTAAPITPLRRVGDRLVDGAWFERTVLFACGEALQTSGTGYINGRGEIQHRAALPGLTYLPPRTQEQVIEAIGAYRWEDAAGQVCPNIVIETQPDREQPFHADAPAWKEIWRFRNCTGEITRTITFTRVTPNQIRPSMIPLPRPERSGDSQTPP